MSAVAGDAWRIRAESGDACEGWPKKSITCSYHLSIESLASLLGKGMRENIQSIASLDSNFSSQ